ncbi:MAG: cold shock domain-containing protein [Hydrogenophaga sp.]|uniref:cold shock domain-containing protein n=1 Tax=Hydrogenophaga sp. TaxID=1904254 RepID=UPI0026149FE9|nr:cold shock domain-containing protein [Hydrogenophaga sp.]MCW5672083.1 cold shock domain-containing protein [Hydrogenophaga sp.]
MANQSDVEHQGIGTIKCFFPFKGFGFITREKGKDLFFFYKSLKDESRLVEGMKVRFKIDMVGTGKGPFAYEIERIG